MLVAGCRVPGLPSRERLFRDRVSDGLSSRPGYDAPDAYERTAKSPSSDLGSGII